MACLKNDQDLFGRPFLDKSNKGADFIGPKCRFCDIASLPSSDPQIKRLDKTCELPAHTYEYFYVSDRHLPPAAHIDGIHQKTKG